MENVIYWLLDFFKTRGGKFAGAALVVLVGLSAFKILNDRSETLKAKNEGARSTSEGSTLWGSSETEFSDTNDHLSVEKPYKRFEPKERKHLVVIQKPEKHLFNLKPFKPSGDFVPLPSLIKSQRIVAPTTTNPEPTSLKEAPIEILHGTLLHCQLVSPVDTTMSAAPVVARLTRPLIQKGRLIAPAGAKIYGQYQSHKGSRVFFGEQWRLAAAKQLQLTLKASALQKQHDTSQDLFGLSDGKLGLVGKLVEQQEGTSGWKTVVGTLASATGKLAQERVKTVLGEQVPLSARNALLEGTTTLIDQRLERLKAKDRSNDPVVELIAGVEFYLMIESVEPNQGAAAIGGRSAIDTLLQQTLEQRLNR